MKWMGLLVLAAACTPKPAPVTTPVDTGAPVATTTTTTTTATGGSPQALHFVGRFDRRDPGVATFSFAGSAILARFTGEALDADLETSGQDIFAVTIDGGEPKYVRARAGRNTLRIAAGLSAGTHDVGLYKATEAFVGTVKFYGLLPASAVVPSPFPFAHRIEIIGDSISNGYGVLGPDGNCPFRPETESEFSAWGAIAARRLNAAHTTIAYSGRGVVRNSMGTTTGTMQSVWERTSPDAAEPSWDFASYTPEVVVINLGTNDFARGDPGPSFADGYFELLRAVRQRYPDASIVCALGTMMSPSEVAKARTYVKDAMKRLDDSRVAYLELSASPDEGFGCGRHPSAKTQEKMGAALAVEIKERMRW